MSPREHHAHVTGGTVTSCTCGATGTLPDWHPEHLLEVTQAERLTAAFGALGTLPHCGARVLHAPTDGCQACDARPDWQALRTIWEVAFTGHTPAGPLTPCPSDAARGTAGAHVWYGNRPWRGDTR